MVAAGADLHAAMRVANHAAGIVVGKLGTAVVHRDELAASLGELGEPDDAHRHRRGRIHRIEPREGAQRARRDATSSRSTTSRAPTRSPTSRTSRSPTSSTSATSSRASRAGEFDRGVTAVLHQGACSDTMETDGRYMMENNYDYSLALLRWCHARRGPVHLRLVGLGVRRRARVPGSRASTRRRSTSTATRNSSSTRWCAARSRTKPTAQVAGFRYFNVYGPREAHKGRMASVAFHFYNQYLAEGRVKLFEGSGGYGPGEQLRDFISVEDVVRVNLFFLDHPGASGIFNVGTGPRAELQRRGARDRQRDPQVARARRRSRSTRCAPRRRSSTSRSRRQLVGKYQSYTQADMGALRAAGYGEKFLDVEEGVGRYVAARMAAPKA